jgi:hypothetical protein
MRWLWIAVLLVALSPEAARAGVRSPEWSGTLGSTFAVRSGPVALRERPEVLLGAPDGGGSSASLAALWPVAPRFSFGVMLHGDDAGSTVDSLRDEQGHGLVHGKVEQVHRAAWGVSWRLDAAAPARFGATPFASATWGYYRVADDLRGEELGSVGSAGFSLAAGARWPLGRHFALGAVVRYHRLFNDREGRFMSAGLDFVWR